jgi:hypothetical protein
MFCLNHQENSVNLCKQMNDVDRPEILINNDKLNQYKKNRLTKFLIKKIRNI